MFICTFCLAYYGQNNLSFDKDHLIFQPDQSITSSKDTTANSDEKEDKGKSETSKLTTQTKQHSDTKVKGKQGMSLVTEIHSTATLLATTIIFCVMQIADISLTQVTEILPMSWAIGLSTV